MNIESSLESRARRHAALGDPVRLAVVERLLAGDASPGELGRRLGVPSNLMAHHLRLLQDARLVVRRQSEGDRRRTYLQLAPGALDGLVLRPTALPSAPRVVFVCRANSARSQLAAALWGRLSRIPSASAGTRPAAHVHPEAVAVGRRHGLVLDGVPRALADVLRPADWVVAVCDNAYEELARDAAAPATHWSIPDPVRVGTRAAFEHSFAEIQDRTARLARAVAGETSTPAGVTPEGARG